MTSALDARPKLKDDLKIVRREVHGQVHYVVKEPKEDKYYQFGETEVGLMQLMDGQRTAGDIADAADKTLGVRPPDGQIADFAQKLKRLGLVERTPAEQHLMLMERMRSQRKIRARGRTRGSILRLRFSIGDPDRLFGWIVSRAPWAWRRPFVLATVALFVTYFVILALRWDQFWGGTVGLYLLQGFTAWDWVMLYAIGLGVGAIHELGHGLTTKAFGGEVHEIGGMLLYFQPALFCNTNDAWIFEKRSHRLWVTFGGPWVEMIIAALAGIVWVLTQPGTLVNNLAFLTVLSAGILAVLTNLNPLLPLDGYYALSDWLEIPNLRRRAFEYWGWIGKRFAFAMDVASPSVTPRERRVFLIYGGLAILYSLFVMVVSGVWLILVIGRLIGPVVWLILALILFKSLRHLSSRGQALAHAAATTWRAGFARGGRTPALIAAIVLVIGLPFILPWTFRAKGDFRVEAMPRSLVRAQVDGILDRWYVNEGDTVRAGDPIATLWNPELEASLLELQSRAERLSVSRAASETRDDLASAASFGSVLRQVQQQLAVLHARQERLVIKAPIDGVVLGYRMQERLGESLADGDLLVELAALGARYARVWVPIRQAGEVDVGQTVTLKLLARPDIKFISSVAVVAPAAEDGWLEAQVPIISDIWQPSPGMTGIAKIRTRRGTIAQAIGRAVRQTVRIDLLL